MQMKRLISLLWFINIIIPLQAQLFNSESLKAISSSYDEQSPVLSPDGRSLYFTRAHHPDNVGGKKDPGDVWFSTLQADNTWSAPQHAGATINNRQYNAVAGFSADGSLMYLHNHYSKTTDAARTQGISFAKKTTNGWSVPENITIPYFINRSAIQSGSISESGKYFIFSADSYGTLGTEDLYVCVNQNGRWSEPRNLGVIINSAFQELSPYLAADDKTLYFSTNGRGGKGSFDVFSSTRLDDSWTNWSNPQNLGEVNTEGRELFFRLDKEAAFAFYTSTLNSDGYGDIKLWVPELAIAIEEVTEEEIKESYTVPVDPLIVENRDTDTALAVTVEQVKTLLLTGHVKDESKQIPVQANIRVKGKTENYLIQSDTTGYFELAVDIQDVYEFTLSAVGYVSKSERVERRGENLQSGLTFFLVPVAVGTLVNLKNVLFERGKPNLLPDSFPELDLVAQFLLENPEVEIELAGHTDNRGTQNALMRLSNERVQVVKDYLVERGVDARRISGKGYGGTRPITDNYAEVSRQLNRRVEFTIVKK